MELNMMPDDEKSYPLDGPVRLEGIGKVGVMSGGFLLSACSASVLIVHEPELAQSIVVSDLQAAGLKAESVNQRAAETAGATSRQDMTPVICDKPPQPSEPQQEIGSIVAALGLDALLVIKETGSMSYPEQCTFLAGCNAAASHAQLGATLFARDGHVLWNGGGFADGELKRPNPVTWALGVSPSADAARKGAAEMMVRDLLADARK